MSVKQVIVMRKDLNMRKGKMIAQGAHASMKVFFDKMHDIDNGGLGDGLVTKSLDLTGEEYEWVNGLFTKICVSVNSEQELLDIHKQAKEAGLNCALIKDSGLTEFDGLPTFTCCAIGPNDADAINLITGKLPLL